MLAAGAALVAAFSILAQANAASGPVSYTTTPFTTAEVSAWTPDRTSPTGGYSSTSFAGRNNVLEMRFTGSLASSTPFYQTEGLQRDIPNSDSVKADVYVDSDWSVKTVRAGLWGVGHDATDAVSSYPVIEYTTDGFTGWRYWDVDHWTTLPSVAANVSAWNTVEVTHDATAHTFVYHVNGAQVASVSDEGSATIGEAILNSKNYGGVVNYAAHWSNFAYGDVVSSPTTKEACKNNGWQAFGFKNQGQCVSSVASNKNN
jgi:hypothetical protein